MVIRWTRAARLSLRDIFLYVEHNFGRSVATRVVKQIYDEVSYLGTFPRLGVFEGKVNGIDYRAIVSKRHKVYYSIEGDVVKVHLVWDTRRDPPQIKQLL